MVMRCWRHVPVKTRKGWNTGQIVFRLCCILTSKIITSPNGVSIVSLTFETGMKWKKITYIQTMSIERVERRINWTQSNAIEWLKFDCRTQSNTNRILPRFSQLIRLRSISARFDWFDWFDHVRLAHLFDWFD